MIGSKYVRPLNRYLRDRAIFAGMWLRWLRLRLRDAVTGGAGHEDIPKTFLRSARRWHDNLSASAKSRSPLTHVYDAGEIALQLGTGAIQDGVGGEYGRALESRARPDYPEMFVIGIEHGRVLDQTGEVVTREGTILADLSVTDTDGMLPWVKVSHRPFALPEPPAEVRKLGRACTIVSQYAAWNYFHWMLNSLPRLHVFSQARLRLAEMDSVVTNALERPFHAECLARAGLADAPIVECGEWFCGEADVLFATRSIRAAGHRCRWAIDYVRSLFRECISPSSGTRLYVSRSDARTRRIANEDEIVETLSPLGFRLVILSDMTVCEQARVFSSASVIVGGHGAGLTNLLFCHRDTLVVELLSPLWLRTYYLELASAMQLRYSYVVGDCKRGAPGGARVDYAIPVRRLAEHLKKIGM